MPKLSEGAIVIYDYLFKAIGYIETPYNDENRPPCQNYKAPDVRGRVVFDEKYTEALRDVERFSHLYLFFVFNKSEGWDAVVTPFLSDEKKGLFATRINRRPNPLGMTVVKLLQREGNVLDVEGVDMYDGSPLIDMKPYVPRFDYRPEADNGWLEDVEE
jgi:tRNA-Thr(GGU) m(6)t(6)A37 methyltransferase TsaA